MTIHADAAYLIGHGHAVCQDYAIAAGTHGGRAVALLADGCSGSPDTDVGARLLVRAALAQLPPSLPNTAEALDSWVERAIVAAGNASASLGLPGRATDATLLGVHAEPAGRFVAFAHGDGVLALGRRDGGMDVYAVSYGRGCPTYPSYRLDAGRWAAFNGLEGNERVVEAARIGGAGEPPCLESCGKLLWLSGKADEYRFAAVLSDGVQSYRAEQTVGHQEVLGHLLGFKSLTGAFVQRRLSRFEKESVGWGWRHHDDVSLAVVAFGG